MRGLVSKGIVLTRLNFGEADRIITFITPDQGKVRVIAKGVRKIKSKLAGGIELFSESNITFLRGRGEIGTLFSSRLIQNYDHIVKDLERTTLGYEFLKMINRATEDAGGEEYFELLKLGLAGLDNLSLSLDLLELWFVMQLVKISGHSPNLNQDTKGRKLEPLQKYAFDIEAMTFQRTSSGPFSANHIKLLRLGVGAREPVVLLNVIATEKEYPESLRLARAMLIRFVRV